VANLDLDAQDNEGNTALIHAAQAGHYEVVELILKQSIDVDQRNHRGFSALMKAAIQGQIESVRFLLGHGADHTITDPTRGMCAQGEAFASLIFAIMEEYFLNKAGRSTATDTKLLPKSPSSTVARARYASRATGKVSKDLFLKFTNLWHVAAAASNQVRLPLVKHLLE